jgi:hypothetical protein
MFSKKTPSFFLPKKFVISTAAERSQQTCHIRTVFFSSTVFGSEVETVSIKLNRFLYVATEITEDTEGTKKGWSIRPKRSGVEKSH